MNNELLENLKTLGIDKTLDFVTRKEINECFKRLAKALHPDKTGDHSTTSEFQKVRCAYENVRDYLDKHTEAESDQECEERFFNKNFQNSIFQMKIKEALQLR